MKITILLALLFLTTALASGCASPFAIVPERQTREVAQPLPMPESPKATLVMTEQGGMACFDKPQTQALVSVLETGRANTEIAQHLSAAAASCEREAGHYAAIAGSALAERRDDGLDWIERGLWAGLLTLLMVLVP